MNLLKVRTHLDSPLLMEIRGLARRGSRVATYVYYVCVMMTMEGVFLISTVQVANVVLVHVLVAKLQLVLAKVVVSVIDIVLEVCLGKTRLKLVESKVPTGLRGLPLAIGIGLVPRRPELIMLLVFVLWMFRMLAWNLGLNPQG